MLTLIYFISISVQNEILTNIQVNLVSIIATFKRFFKDIVL